MVLAQLFEEFRRAPTGLTVQWAAIFDTGATAPLGLQRWILQVPIDQVDTVISIIGQL